MGTVSTLAFHHHTVSARPGTHVQWGSGQRTPFKRLKWPPPGTASSASWSRGVSFRFRCLLSAYSVNWTVLALPHSQNTGAREPAQPDPSFQGATRLPHRLPVGPTRPSSTQKWGLLRGNSQLLASATPQSTPHLSEGSRTCPVGPGAGVLPGVGAAHSHVRRVHGLHVARVQQLVVHGDQHTQAILQLVLVNDA